MDPVGAAREVGPKLAPRSRDIEANRTLPDDVVQLLRGAGLFKLFVPATLGGSEAHVLAGLRAIEEVAYHDGSAGWCVMIGGTTGLLGAFLPPDHATEIYGPPESVTGGLAAPLGRATAVDGGLRVTGHWQWGSGSRHCTWIGGGCLLVDGDGAPAPRADGLLAPFVLFERDQVELLDTWHVAGLKGTGSTDYEVHDAFVPEGRWVQVGRAEPLVDSPLYRFSFLGLLAVGIAAVAHGLARRSVDELVELAATKLPQGSSKPLAERAPVQAEVARAEGALRSSWAWLEQVAGATWDDLLAGRALTDEAKRTLRLAATHATTEAAAVVDRMYTAGGGASVYDDSPLQRVFRDVHVATQHAMVAPRTFELVGRMRLGLDTDTRQL